MRLFSWTAMITLIETKYLLIQKSLLNHTRLKLNVASDLRKTGNSLWDKVDMFNITNMLNPESATES